MSNISAACGLGLHWVFLGLFFWDDLLVRGQSGKSHISDSVSSANSSEHLILDPVSWAPKAIFSYTTLLACQIVQQPIQSAVPCHGSKCSNPFSAVTSHGRPTTHCALTGHWAFYHMGLSA